ATFNRGDANQRGDLALGIRGISAATGSGASTSARAAVLRTRALARICRLGTILGGTAEVIGCATARAQKRRDEGGWQRRPAFPFHLRMHFPVPHQRIRV